EVGRHYQWTDRLHWSDDRICEHLGGPVWLWLLSVRGAPAGYFELARSDDGGIEIAYFGMLPEFVGQGIGKQMLTRAVEEAWALEPIRVWLHTCTLDHPSALPNYIKRGFRPIREEKYLVEHP
ncbi:MAG: GNAT family N-acetyltransferase, partial [Gemmatimonadota bacterium]